MSYQPENRSAAKRPGGFRLKWWALVVAPALLFFDADAAHALQSHGGIEGMVVHQFAHAHYIVALAVLWWDLSRPDFVARPWPLLRCFCVLMILWNCLAIVGHFAQLSLPESDIITDDGYLSAFLLLPLSLNHWLYYVAALDHLLCAPALLCLFLAMRRFYCDSLEPHPTEAAP
ncbi:MAG: hypothetical protein LBU39_04395 [Desulfobulbaceae bacterium]|jgi:hypothetical protein|nr:hypothetical protein [Desulfobulbaceae bacterium]